MTREQDVHELIRQLKVRADPKVFAKLEERIDELTDEIETLKLVAAPPSIIDHWVKLGLTKSECRIMRALERAGKNGTSQESLLAAMCFDRPNDWPEIKIIEVFMVRIRKKIANSGYVVRTVYGTGYVLEVPAIAA